MFDPTHWNQVKFDQQHKKLVQFVPLHRSHVSTHHWNQGNFDLHSNIKSISIPADKNRGNFDPDTTIKWFPTVAQKPGPFRLSDQFQPPTKEPNEFHPHTEIKSISTTHIKKQVNFDAYTKTKWLPALRTPSQFRPPTQNASQSIPTPKTSHLRPVLKNQVNFHPYI